MGKIICIKARSHSDFELYLIGEKYDIPYDFLAHYKNDKLVYKFWTEVGSGRVMAIEERPTDKKKVFIPIIPMSKSDEKEIKDIKPIISGHIISKYKGNIEKKEKEFKDMIESIEKNKKEMLNRKYDHSNILCLNGNSTMEQLFAVCVNNQLDFIEVAGFIENNSHMDIKRVWYEKLTTDLVAYEYINEQQEFFEINEYCLIPRDAIYKMSRNPIPTPKIKISEYVISEYNKAKEFGFDINIPKLETNNTLNITMDLFSIEELNDLLKTAIETEDYESAAEIRDIIKDMSSKKTS